MEKKVTISSGCGKGIHLIRIWSGNILVGQVGRPGRKAGKRISINGGYDGRVEEE
ncbi:hypothetical protein [Lacrimispora saccharolytica]|uniref:hypothetical protein n=1 Tax=Lacrimispora saccharolytica TaxID=84030 RepID=UPI00195ADD52|nr:hypothetical protein [Lacrimispora saccharolytica]QRV19457.1 hypothetical protein I6K70_18745 [Lacrimispora saccharolytica]